MSIFVQAATTPAYDVPINVSTKHTHTSKPEEGKKTPEEEAQREGREEAKFFFGKRVLP